MHGHIIFYIQIPPQSDFYVNNTSFKSRFQMSHHYYLVLMMACCLPWLFFAFGLVFCLSLGYAGIFDPACFAHTYNKACTWIFISVVTHFCNISRKRKYINPTTTSKKQAKRCQILPLVSSGLHCTYFRRDWNIPLLYQIYCSWLHNA